MNAYFIKIFFPDAYRALPFRRSILGVLRALHILFFSILVGGLYFNQSKEQVTFWIVGVLITGILMFLMELYASLMVLFEFQSIAIIIKIIALYFMTFLNEQQTIYLLMALILFSSLVSHATKRVRHINIAPLSFQKKYGFKKGKSL